MELSHLCTLSKVVNYVPLNLNCSQEQVCQVGSISLSLIKTSGTPLRQCSAEPDGVHVDPSFKVAYSSNNISREQLCALMWLHIGTWLVHVGTL